MIVRPRPSLWQILFSIKGSIIVTTYRQIIAIGFLSAIIVGIHEIRPGFLAVLSGTPMTLLGISLSVFLAFKNRTCFDRWWEARKAWGQLIYTSRDLMRETQCLSDENRKTVLTLLMSYGQALVLHLRPRDNQEKVTKYLTEVQKNRYLTAKNKPNSLLQMIGEELSALYKAQQLTDILYQNLDHSLRHISMMQATCERIKTTPIPFAYTLLLHRTAYTFCFLLPFGFDNTLGWFTPFVAAFAAYTFFGWDALGSELEDPFDNGINALPIAALADMIEILIRESLGEKDLPPLPAKDLDDVLM